MNRRLFLFGALGAAVPLPAVATATVGIDLAARDGSIGSAMWLAAVRERAMVSYMIERRVWEPEEIAKCFSVELELLEDLV